MKLGVLLKTNPFFKIGELLVLFVLAFLLVKVVLPLAENNPIYKQLILWVANIFMLIYIWIGLKLRGDTWKDLGLTFKSLSLKSGIRTFLLSILVFILALAGFMIGSIIMANITGIPESANMSGYNYLKENVGMLILTLCGVYIASSLGEEIIYRGFLINRISSLLKDTRIATIIAVILSALIFGLIHYQWGPMGIVQTGFMGLVLGICYIKLKKRLWILVLAHAYMDTILMVQMFAAGSN